MHKVRHTPIQRPPWALANISVTGAQFGHRWCYLVTIIITHRQFDIIIIRYQQVRPHRLPYILKVYLSIRLLHLRGRDTQAGGMGTTR